MVYELYFNKAVSKNTIQKVKNHYFENDKYKIQSVKSSIYSEWLYQLNLHQYLLTVIILQCCIDSIYIT